MVESQTLKVFAQSVPEETNSLESQPLKATVQSSLKESTPPEVFLFLFYLLEFLTTFQKLTGALLEIGCCLELKP